MGEHTYRCCAQESLRRSAPCCRRRSDLRLLDMATMLSVAPPSPDAYHRIRCREEEESPRSNRHGPAEVGSKADHESDEPPEKANTSGPGVPPRQFGIERPMRPVFPAIVRHPGGSDGLRTLLQGNAESFNEPPQPSAAEALVRPQVQGTDASRLWKPPREGHVQEVSPVLTLEGQDTPAVRRALLHNPRHVFGRVEDRTPNAVGTNGIPALPASGVPYDQVRSVGVQPSPAYDVSPMRRHASWAYRRLVRLPQHSTSPWLLRHHSPTHTWLDSLTRHSSSWRP